MRQALVLGGVFLITYSCAALGMVWLSRGDEVRLRRLRAALGVLRRQLRPARQRVAGGWARYWQGRLRRAGLEASPSTLGGRLLAGWLAVTALGVAVGLPVMLCALLAPALTAGAVHVVLQWKERNRLRAMEAQLPDLLQILINSLRAGYSLPQALSLAASECDAPVREELERVLRELRLNASLDEALDNLVRRVPSRDLELVTQAIIIQRQVGGNLVEVLSNINRLIRDRIQLAREVRVLTSQGRLSGWVVGLLPVAMGLVLWMLAPWYVTHLVGNPLGRLLLGCAAMMEAIGAWVISRIVKVEY